MSHGSWDQNISFWVSHEDRLHATLYMCIYPIEAGKEISLGFLNMKCLVFSRVFKYLGDYVGRMGTYANFPSGKFLCSWKSRGGGVGAECV